jgi:hypothetical protein
MAKTKISEWSSTPANNTDIDSINIAEGCAPSGINDAIRELMAQVKDLYAGTSGDIIAVTAGGTGVGTSTGSGNNVLSTSPTLVTPVLGTPTSVTLTNATGLPIATGVSGLGTGVATALAVNVGSAGAPVVNGGALGTPSSGTVTNLTGTASININGTVGATTPTTGAFTTVAASSSVTLSGGTANGVTYLNGSKVLTSGSALTFDGSQLLVKGNERIYFNTFTNSTTYAGYIGRNTSTGNFEIGSQTIGGNYPIDFFVGTQASMKLSSSGVFNFYDGSGGDRMVLNSTGLGIGTSSPNKLLTLNSATNDVEVLRINAPGASGGIQAKADIGFGFFDTVAEASAAIGFEEFGTSSAGGILLFKTRPDGASQSTRPTERMRISQAGLVGIGTSSPACKLNVDGTNELLRLSGTTPFMQFFGSSACYIGDSSQLITSGTAGDLAIRIGNAATNKLVFGMGATAVATLDSSGNLGLGVTPSAWDTIKALQSGNGSFYGFSTTEMGVNQNMYYASGAYRYITSAVATAYRQISGVHSWHNAASGTAGNAISFTQAMTLTASGQLAIGLTSASTTLHVSGATTTDGSIKYNQTLQSTGAYNATPMSGTLVALKYNAGGDFAGMGGWSIGKENATDGNYSSYFAMHTRANGSDITERARITSGGLFLINSTSALVNESSFAATSSGNTACIKTTGGTGTQPLLIWNSGTSGTRELITFSTGASFSSQGGITSNGTVLTYGGTSDYRLKEISGGLSGYKERILAIQPKQGTWKTDNSEFRGFLAHEFAEQYPASVIGEKDAVDTDGNPKYQSMQASSSEVMADLIAMVKDLIAENESLKARLDAANL